MHSGLDTTMRSRRKFPGIELAVKCRHSNKSSRMLLYVSNFNQGNEAGIRTVAVGKEQSETLHFAVTK